MSFIENRLLQYWTVFFIGFSFLGGTLLPLSPNIEQLRYTQTDSTLTFTIETPKLEENITKFYLKKNVLGDTSSILLFPNSSQRLSNGYLLVFQHPKNFNNFQKGDVLDFVCHTESWGVLRYFSAFFIDTVIGNQTINSTKNLVLPQKGFHLSFPNRIILRESIRNLFFHVPMWFSMIALLIYSLVQSILFLMNGKLENDMKASLSARTGLIFGILGLLTGMLWANYTWGTPWTNDPKLNGAAIGMLAYFAYFVLRNSIEDEIKRAKLSAVYNIFSFTIYMVFIMILPRINDSLHPGNGGNPGFNVYEQDNIMRIFFYPAVAGWIMLGFWMTELYSKIKLRN